MHKLLIVIFFQWHLTDDNCFYNEQITYILNMKSYFLIVRL